MSNKLVITRGLPGCGKSTAARAWVLEDPDNRAEVNRDHIRLMVGGFEVGSPAQEAMVTKVSHESIRALLKSGKSVISSDTNLPLKYVNQLSKIATSMGLPYEIWDMTDVPLETCIARNGARLDKNPVPVSVIRRMYFQSVDKKGYPLPVPDGNSGGRLPDIYVPPIVGIEADICDIDGTVADSVGIRSPYDYAKVGLDRAKRPVIDLLHSRYYTGQKIIFVSGRPDIKDVRRDTEEWLHKHVRLPYEALYMRPADRLSDDDRNIKRDLFDQHIRHDYRIGVVFDDRDRVIRMWREELGLTALQVAYGDF